MDADRLAAPGQCERLCDLRPQGGFDAQGISPATKRVPPYALLAEHRVSNQGRANKRSIRPATVSLYRNRQM